MGKKIDYGVMADLSGEPLVVPMKTIKMLLEEPNPLMIKLYFAMLYKAKAKINIEDVLFLTKEQFELLKERLIEMGLLEYKSNYDEKENRTTLIKYIY